MFLPLQGLFFEEEAIDVSQVEHCTQCQGMMAECRTFSSKKALLTAEEGEEYNMIKEHITFNVVTGSYKQNIFS